MTDDFPAAGGPAQPPSGLGVPSGYQPPLVPQPPSGSASSEYLDSGQGVPMAPMPAVARSGGGRRALFIGGGVVGVLALAGAGTWAVLALAGGGPQPSEALPASTLGYASVDLDPSAGQKIEAIKMIKKFPGIDDGLGLDAQDDLREALFNAIQKDADCANLDYKADFGWLGNRAAVAAIRQGDDDPTGVLVLASTDAKAAEAGLRSLSHCVKTGDADEAGDVAASMGWSINEDWAVIAETDEIADQVLKDAAKANLAQDADYQKWMDEVGDPGIVTMYASPEVGEVLADVTARYADQAEPGSADAATKQMKEFKGMAGTVRFHDGALQFEYAAATTKDTAALVGPGGDDMVASLPTDTAMALGIGLKQGWLASWLDHVSELAGSDVDIDEMMSEAESETGLSLPEDIETLLGDSAALVMGGDFDANALDQSDPSDVPVALKVHGDPEKISQILAKLTAQMPGEDADVLGTSIDGDVIVIGPNADYRDTVLKGGSLGQSKPYTSVIADSERASVVMYVDFDVNDWLVNLVGDDPELVDNIKPLSSLGISAWVDGDVAHAQVQLSTD